MNLHHVLIIKYHRIDQFELAIVLDCLAIMVDQSIQTRVLIKTKFVMFRNSERKVLTIYCTWLYNYICKAIL